MSDKRKLSEESAESPRPSTSSAAESTSNAALLPVNTSCHVLSNGYANSPKSFLIATTQNRYLFNCGEGTVRIMNEQNLKLPRLKEFFMTRFDWNNFGGLTALILTMHEIERPFRIHSPVKLTELVEKKYNLLHYDYEKEGELCNEDLSVRPITLESTNAATSTASAEKKVFAYLVKFPKSLPKLRIEKLDLTKHKPGPWLRALKEGQDVTLDDGTVLKASDYLDVDDSVNKYMLVLDCPDLSYLDMIAKDPLINLKQMSLVAHMGESAVINDERYLSWVRDYASRECMHLYFDEKFPNNCLSPVYETQAKLNLLDESIFRLLPGQTDEFKRKLHNKKIIAELRKSEYNIHYARSKLVVSIKPKLQLVYDEQSETVDNKAAQYAIIDEFYQNQRCLPEEIEPSLVRKVSFLKRRLDLRYLPSDIEKAEPEEEPKEETAVTAKEDPTKNPLFYPNLVVLGSASATQTDIRNVSGLLLNVNDKVNMILDCGDFTLGQLSTYYGEDQVDKELVKVRAISISHVHYDHITGLINLIIKRRQAFLNLNRQYEKFYLLFPKLLLLNLVRLDKMMPELELFDQFDLVPNELLLDYSQKTYTQYQLNPKGKDNATYDNLDLGKVTKFQLKHFTWGDRERLLERLHRRLGLNSINTIPVTHIIHSFGTCLDIKTPEDETGSFKLAFSGDCRPTDPFAYRFQDCDLLVHECTFDNTHQQDAIRKRHSTTAEALTISRKMRAKHTLLTHFSNRYGNYGITDDLKATKTVGFSFDFMNVNRANLADVPALLPFTEIVFSKKVRTNQEVLMKNESKKNRSVFAQTGTGSRKSQ